jgi:glycosyltransferase involved in cell wall biosynthesis
MSEQSIPQENTSRALDDFRILIATPHSYSTVFKEWFVSYEQLIKPKNVRLYMDPNLPLDVNRNNAVKEALEGDCEYIFFVDHDNILPPNTLIKLLEFNVPVVGSLYFERKYPHLPLVYTFEQDFQTVRVEYTYPKGLVRCDVIGLGCSLFKMEVFKSMPEPWFCYNYKDRVWGTEDIAFFHKLKDMGVAVFIDTINTVGHLSNNVVDEGDWLFYKEGYLEKVDQKATELGTKSVFLDKNKGVLRRSPSDIKQ